MPHILIEYSANLASKPAEKNLAELHDLLPAIGPYDLQSIKSRIVEHGVYRVAGGGSTAAFVHLELAILAGRTPEIKRRTSERLLEYLRANFSSDAQQISMSVEIRDMDAASYSKYASPVR